jgi:hypothetical protein
MPFAKHPYPWSYVSQYGHDGNGASFDIIVDATGECVASSLNGGFDALWAFYNQLNETQIECLGHKEPDIMRILNTKDYRIDMLNKGNCLVISENECEPVLCRYFPKTRTTVAYFEPLKNKNDIICISDGINSHIKWREPTPRELYLNKVGD